MAGSATRNLYIQIGGSASDLTVAAKAGKSALLELGDSADDVQATVRGAFEKMGGSVADQAKAMEDAYAKSFANIRSTALAALKQPTSAGQATVLNLSAARDEAEQAQQSATFLRALSDAQARLVESGQEASAGAKSLAVSLELQAIAAEKNALASAESVAGLTRLAAASGIAVNDLDEVAGAHTRIGASGLIAEHVVRSFADSVTAGQSPVRAFALEVPRITEALQFLAMESGNTTGLLGKFAGFMGGPWGIAITLGTSLLAPLIANLVESGHAAEDAKKAEQDYAKALDGVGDAIDKANGKLVERNRLLATVGLQAKRGEIDQAQSDAKSKSDQAFDAARAKADPLNYGSFVDKASLSIAVSHGADPKSFTDPAVQKAIDSANGDVLKLRTNLDELAKQASGSNKADLEKLADTVSQFAGMSVVASQKAQQLRNDAAATITVLGGGSILTAESIRRSAADRAAVTPLDKARNRVQDLNERINDVGGQPVSPEQQAELKKLAAAYDDATAAVKRLEAAQHDAAANRQFGRQIDVAQATQIIQSIGGRVTSGYRSHEDQERIYADKQAGRHLGPVAVPGTSAHERGQAVDVAFGPGITIAAIKKAFADAGVALHQVLTEKDQGVFHVDFGKRGPSADTLARRQEAQVVHTANDDRAFQSQLASAQSGYSAAAIALTGDDAQKGSADRAELAAGLVQKRAELADQVTAKKLTQAQADQLAEIYAGAEELAEISSLQKERLAGIDKQLATEQLQTQGTIALLDLQQALATTTKARRDLALRLLAQDEAQQRAPLQAILDHPELHTADEVGRAKTQLGQIDAEHPLKVQQIDRQNASPGRAFADQLNNKSISDSLQQVAVDGLGHLEDGLEGVLSGTKSVKAAFSDMARSIIADLLKIGIEQEIIKPIATSLFGTSGGASGAAGGGGVFSFLGSLLHFADGGHITGAGTGRSDSIVARLSNGEFVVNAASTKRFLPVLHAINDNRMPRFADGGLVGGIPTPARLTSADVRMMSRTTPIQIAISAEEGALFRPVVHSIAGQHAQVAEGNATEAGAQLAQDRAQWRQGRQLGAR